MEDIAEDTGVNIGVSNGVRSVISNGVTIGVSSGVTIGVSNGVTIGMTRVGDNDALSEDNSHKGSTLCYLHINISVSYLIYYLFIVI